MEPRLTKSWPAEYGPATETVLRATRNPARSEVRRAIREFCTFALRSGLPAILSVEALRGFKAELNQSLGRVAGNSLMRQIYRIGILGPDPLVRDWLFENHVDRRNVDEILDGPLWPGEIRVLARQTEFLQKRRVLLELDNLFRCRERVGDLPFRAPLAVLFLADGLRETTRYGRLGRLCTGLEIFAPHHPDLTTLRAAQAPLCARAYPHSARTLPPARRIPEVETLLAASRHQKTGKPWAEETITGRRSALNLHHDIQRAAGRPFAFDKPALDLFADVAFAKHAIWADDGTKGGWCRRSVAGKIMHLAPFIPDRTLRREWNAFAGSFSALAKKRGDPKMKEIAMAKNPVDLDSFFRIAVDLMQEADVEMSVQSRNGIHVMLGALGILLFYPLRKGDLLRLRIGVHLLRSGSGWLLAIGQTQKERTKVRPLRLPREATRFLDACVLRGAPPERIFDLFKRRNGEPLLRSPRRGAAYEPGAFSDLFRRRTGHSPHILRSVWCDRLVLLGADRLVIAAMLQHDSIISQSDYEIIAAKIRGIKAAEALAQIANDALAA